MRLNALHPSDNPMEELLFCFGGGGDGGGGGEADGPPGSGMGPTDVATTSGGNRSSTSSERGGGGGGSSNDNDGDGVPNSIDATPNGGRGTSFGDNVAASGLGGASQSVADAYGSAVGSIGAGVDAFGPGGAAGRGYGPSGYGSDSNVGPAEGIGAAGPGPSTPNITEAQAIANRTGIPANTMVTDGKGNVVRGRDGSPVTAGRSVTEAAQALGISEQAVRDQLGAAAGTDFGEGFGKDDAVSAVEQAIAGLGVGDVTQTPGMQMQMQMTPMGRAVQSYTNNAVDAFAAGDLAGRSPLASTAQQAQGAGSLAAAAEAFNAPTGIAAAAPGTADRGAAKDTTGIGALAEGLGTLDNVPTGTTGVLAPGVGAAATPAATSTPVASVEQAIADFSQGISAGTPTPSTAQTGFSGLGPVGTGQAFSPAMNETVPGFGASVNQAIEDFGAQRVGRTQEMMDDGTVVTEDFGLQRANLVETPTDFLSSYSPLDQQLMQEGTRALSGADFSQAGIPTSIDIFGTQIPTGLGMVEGAINAVFNPAYSTTQAIRAGATPVYGAQGNILGATSEDGSIAYSNDPYGDMARGFRGELDPAMQAAYDNARAMQDAARGDGGGSEVILPPIEGGAGDGETVPEEYQGRNIVNDAVYGPAPTPSYNYTGLPSLAPVKLRPTFRARGNYSPLFPTLPTS